MGEPKHLAVSSDRRLMEYYNKYIRGKHGAELINSIDNNPLVIDIVNDNYSFGDLDEMSRFMKKFHISNIQVITNNAHIIMFEVFNNIPVDNLRNIDIKGNLDGLRLPNYTHESRENKDTRNEFLVLENLKLEHLGQKPAKIEELGISPKLKELYLSNIGYIGKIYRHAMYRGFRNTKLNLDAKSLGLRINGDNEFENLDLTRISNLLINYDDIKRHFPKVTTIQSNLKDESVQSYKGIEEIVEDLSLIGHIRTRRNLLPEIRKYIVSHKDSIKKTALLLNLVGFEDGTYINQRSIKLVNLYDLMKEDDSELPDAVAVGVKDLTELSLQDALKIKNLQNGKRKVCVHINNSGANDTGVKSTNQGFYSLDQYIAIMDKFNELLEGVDLEKSEEKKFATLYKRVAQCMRYDYQAGYPQNKKQDIYSDSARYSCRNFEALLSGKGVCAAYAYVLHNACKLAGIESRYIAGQDDVIVSNHKKKRKYNPPQTVGSFGKHKHIEREYHAWNKVKLNGVWYNVDPTWDNHSMLHNEFPSFALLSDKTLRRLGRTDVGTRPNEPKCEIDADESFVKRIFPFVKRNSHRTLNYDKDVLEYATGEKIEEVNPNGFHKIKNRFMQFIDSLRQGEANPKLLDESGVTESDNMATQEDNPWKVEGITGQGISKTNNNVGDVQKVTGKHFKKDGIDRDEL